MYLIRYQIYLIRYIDIGQISDQISTDINNVILDIIRYQEMVDGI